MFLRTFQDVDFPGIFHMTLDYDVGSCLMGRFLWTVGSFWFSAKKVVCLLIASQSILLRGKRSFPDHHVFAKFHDAPGRTVFILEGPIQNMTARLRGIHRGGDWRESWGL